MYKNSGLFYIRQCTPTPPPFLVLPPAFSIKCAALKLPTSMVGKTGIRCFLCRLYINTFVQDPFFKVYSLLAGLQRTLIAKSSVVNNARNPSWPAIELITDSLYLQEKMDINLFYK